MKENETKNKTINSRFLLLTILGIIPIPIGIFLIVYSTTTNAIYDTPLEIFCIIFGSAAIAISIFNLIMLFIKNKPKKEKNIEITQIDKTKPIIIFASNNKHKIEEMKELLKQYYMVYSLADIGMTDEIEENGTTFLENALIKTSATMEFLKQINKNYSVIADDSGLCVDALNGEPGVYSARYAGNHDFAASREKLLLKLKGKKNRAAHFECCIVKMEPDETYKAYVGQTHGVILKEEIGSKEFGYNCLFFSNDLKKAFGEASIEERNSVSHRGRAIKNMLEDKK